MLKTIYHFILSVLPLEVSERIRLCVGVILNPLPPPPEPPISYSPRETFAAAKEEAGLGYSTPELLIGASRPNVEAHLQKLPAFFAPLFAALAIAASEKSGEPLRVLDYGGALGDQYDFAKATFGQQFPLDWTVIETSLYVDYARQQGLNHVRFFKSIDDANSTFDFALFSGVLQYLEHWREPLMHRAVLNSKYILISRVAVGDVEIPFLQTVRSPEKTVKYPGRVMRRADIATALEATHEPIIGWDLDHHMGELGVCPAPAMLWRKRPAQS
jgi:putative methyltransferase (TIGR04325 family)